MENLSKIDLNEFAKVVLGNQELKQRFDEYIYDSVINFFVTEKIDCFENGCIEYQYGTYCDCYLRLKKDRYTCDYIPSAYDALNGMKKSAKNFGCSERLEKLLNQIDKLSGTNLFLYHVNSALQIFFKEEIKPDIDWVEEMSYQIHRGNMPEDLYSDLDCFQDHFDGYLYDKENKIIYKPFPVA